MTFYDSSDVHRLLVEDRVRTRAFRDSILATVREGMTVLDVGAGSGILSLFAAQAGARAVYAVERAPGAAALARALVDRNGLSRVITVIESAMETAHLPEPVDVIVSEWLGVYGVDANMLAPVLLARDRWLRPGGALIPSSVTAWLAPVAHEAAAEAIALHARPYDLDLSPLAPFSLDEAVWLPAGVDAGDLRAEPMPLWVTDVASMPALSAQRPYAADLAFVIDEPGVNGLAAWFAAEMPGAAPLSNAPGQPLTHWGQFLFPIAGAGALEPGDTLEVGFHNVPAPVGSHHIWAVRVGDALEVHDTRRLRRAYGMPPWRVYQEAVQPGPTSGRGASHVRETSAS
jgi:precorrin-6B methylase 2